MKAIEKKIINQEDMTLHVMRTIYETNTWCSLNLTIKYTDAL